MTDDEGLVPAEARTAYEALLGYLVSEETARRRARREIALLDREAEQAPGDAPSWLADAERTAQRRDLALTLAECAMRRRETEPILQRFCAHYRVDVAVFAEEAQRVWAEEHLAGEELRLWRDWNVNHDLPQSWVEGAGDP